jgi:DNA-directed RNA polymerase specialized sigma24 family protein
LADPKHIKVEIYFDDETETWRAEGVVDKSRLDPGLRRLFQEGQMVDIATASSFYDIIRLLVQRDVEMRDWAISEQEAAAARERRINDARFKAEASTKRAEILGLHAEGLSLAEICRRVGRSRPTVRSVIDRAGRCGKSIGGLGQEPSATPKISS